MNFVFMTIIIFYYKFSVSATFHHSCKIFLGDGCVTKTFMMVWYIDMEAYHYNGNFIAKEIAIVNSDDSQCFHYFIKNPQDLPRRPATPSCYFQFKRHNLDWNFGKWNFTDAISDIQQHIKDDIVFAKGVEKTKFLQRWFPQLQDTVWISTPFKNLNKCFSALCNVKHGRNCARRKVHELMYADKLYKTHQLVEEVTFAFSLMSLDNK